MAKIKAGILSKVSGKVAGVVGSTWKGTNYLRELVKPSNPNTPLQQAQRSQMKAVVRCARNFTGDVFKPYLDKFLKDMSGYNWFVKSNIKKFNGTDNALTAALIFSTGNFASGGFNFSNTTSALVAVDEDNVPTAAAGHSVVAIGIAYNDTKNLAVIKVEDQPASYPDLIGRWGEVSGFEAGDKVAVAGFYADVDANGVVQAISSSIGQLLTLA